VLLTASTLSESSRAIAGFEAGVANAASR
jgi:hypothetical protein